MPVEPEADVPSPIDLRTMVDAREWAETVSIKRPWREDFLRVFIDELCSLAGLQASVLELGSGPGFLAQRVLSELTFGRYTALDFSEAMHALARERLGAMSQKMEFVLRDFISPRWGDAFPRYDAVITLQAVHELRHKRRVPALYDAVRKLLLDNGVFLVCDHFAGPGGMSNAALYMNTQEHEDALGTSGFGNVTCLLNKGGMVLYRAKLA